MHEGDPRAGGRLGGSAGHYLRHREYPQPPPPSTNNTTSTISTVSMDMAHDLLACASQSSRHHPDGPLDLGPSFTGADAGSFMVTSLTLLTHQPGC